MTRPFNKPPTTYAEQIKLLQQRGMLIQDTDEAAFYLQHLNYYRLGAYWLPFEAEHASHRFIEGTTFSDVLNLYIFDRELRLLVLDAIERIEVSVRSQWAHELAHRHGTHAHLDGALAKNPFYWQTNLDKLRLEVQRSKETFMQHLLTTYSESLPPVWAVCEVMSLGLLSAWYSNLKPLQTRRAIASPFDLDERTFQSWLHHLSLIRNLCAHHARLWNRQFTVTPQVPARKPVRLQNEFVRGSRKLYNTLLILAHAMDVIAPGHHWRSRLKNLVSKHAIPVAAMDFPSDWNQRTIWQDSRP